jgi:diphosphomevalonate decarboxylase
VSSPRLSAHSFRASPNLALVKYWGKSDSDRNLPATSSLGITLGALESVTTVRRSDSADRVELDGRVANIDRFETFFRAIREKSGSQVFFSAVSRNSFPTAAGLASSSSGFAALSCGSAAVAGLSVTTEELSSFARIGSASAARSLYGGFVSLQAGAEHAHLLFDEHHWPELRVILVAVKSTPKEVSSRSAMERARTTSPYYGSWVSSSEELYKECVQAVARRDIERLGSTVRQSYLRMFGTMFSSQPPVMYWQPDSLKVIALCEELRRKGIQAWETMDAGPQVKIICLAPHVEEIVASVSATGPDWTIMVSASGSGPQRIEVV